jgi:uncharacterized membrane protein (DUF2068 family)
VFPELNSWASPSAAQNEKLVCIEDSAPFAEYFFLLAQRPAIIAQKPVLQSFAWAEVWFGECAELVSAKRALLLLVSRARQFYRLKRTARMSKRRHNKGLFAIGIYKWLQGLALLLVSLGFLRCLHRDLGETLQHFADQLRIDPDNKLLGALLSKASLIDDKKVAQLSAIGFVYSVLFLTEGTGLFFEQRWAEYLTLIATASLIPIEIYELIKDPTLVKAGLLVANIFIVVFLFVIVRQPRKRN